MLQLMIVFVQGLNERIFMRITFLILALIFEISGVAYAQYVSNKILQKQIEMDDSNIARWQSQIDEAKADKKSIMNDQQAKDVVAEVPAVKEMQRVDEVPFNPTAGLDVQATVNGEFQ